MLQAPAHPPSQLSLENSLAPTCSSDQPRARPRAPPAPVPARNGAELLWKKPYPAGMYLHRGQLMLYNTLGLFHRVCSQFISLVSAQKRLHTTQRRLILLKPNWWQWMQWHGYASIPTQVSHSSCAGTGRGDAALTALPRNEGASASCGKGWCVKGGSG